MLFLFNDRVIEIGDPHERLKANWQEMGCGHPDELLAREALDYARAVLVDSDQEGFDEDTCADCAALLAVKTFANTALFLRAAGEHNPDKVVLNLHFVPEPCLVEIRTRSDNSGSHASLEPLWVRAA